MVRAAQELPPESATATEPTVTSTPADVYQTVLPFGPGWTAPHEVSVTKSGTVYVADYLGGRVLPLAPGADIQQELPFSGLSRPGQIVVSPAGEVAVADMGNNRIVGLTGLHRAAVGPFSGLSRPRRTGSGCGGHAVCRRQ